MGFQVYVNGGSKKAHTTVHGGSEDRDTAIAMCKEACTKEVAGPGTRAFVVSTSDPMYPNTEDCEIVFSSSVSDQKSSAPAASSGK